MIERYYQVFDKAELLRNALKANMYAGDTFSKFGPIALAWNQLDSALSLFSVEENTNVANYLDLKDENRRLQDLLDMHEEVQDRQLKDLANYEKRHEAISKDMIELTEKVENLKWASKFLKESLNNCHERVVQLAALDSSQK